MTDFVNANVRSVAALRVERLKNFNSLPQDGRNLPNIVDRFGRGFASRRDLRR
jgi:hypothetical protein